VNRRGDPSYDTTPFDPTIVFTSGPPALPVKLVVASVNGGRSPTAGVGFSVVVQAQSASNQAANVAANTGINLSLKTGTGTLSGTLTGVISAGTSQVTITGVSYSKAESGVVITASRTSGDSLPSSDSAAFTVGDVNSTYVASVDFSSTQGQRQWSYLDSTGAALTFDTANNRWQGVESFLLIGPTWMHPGSARDPARRWTAPGSGSVHITGVVKDGDAGGGDGVIATIRQNGLTIRSIAINNGDTGGVSFDEIASVSTGDQIDFVVNAKSNPSYDTTIFDPTIAFTPNAPTMAAAIGP